MCHLPLWARTIPLWLAFLVILVLRRPDGVFDAQFVYEDGVKWYVDARTNGLDSLLWPYAGYLQVIPRTIGLIETLVPTPYAPLVGALVSLAITAAVAVAAFRVWPPLALAVLLLPNTEQALGSPTFLHFYLGIALLIGLLATRLGWPGWLALALSAFAGPSGLLLAPLFAARALLLRDEDSINRFWAVATPSTIQGAVLLSSPRPDVARDTTAFDALSIGGTHLAAMLFGREFTLVAMNIVPAALAAFVVGAAAVFAVLAARAVPRGAAAVAAYVCAISLIAAIAAGSDTRDQLLAPVSAARYFYVAGAALSGFALLAASRGSRAGLALTGFLIFGWVGDFELEARPPSDWATASACLSSPGPCTVPIYPSRQFNIVWNER
jgi:hypothetical protein